MSRPTFTATAWWLPKDTDQVLTVTTGHHPTGHDAYDHLQHLVAGVTALGWQLEITRHHRGHTSTWAATGAGRHITVEQQAQAVPAERSGAPA